MLKICKATLHVELISKEDTMVIQDMPTGKFVEVDWMVSMCERCHRNFNVKDLVLSVKDEENMQRTTYCKSCCEKLAKQFDATH